MNTGFEISMGLLLGFLVGLVGLILVSGIFFFKVKRQGQKMAQKLVQEDLSQQASNDGYFLRTPLDDVTENLL